MKSSSLLNWRYEKVYFRENWRWLAGFYLFNVTDWVLTQIAMRSGRFYETNQVWGDGVIGPFHALMKWGVLPYLAIALASPLHPRLSWLWARLLVLVFCVVCCLNAYELWRGW